MPKKVTRKSPCSLNGFDSYKRALLKQTKIAKIYTNIYISLQNIIILTPKKMSVWSIITKKYFFYRYILSKSTTNKWFPSMQKSHAKTTNSCTRAINIHVPPQDLIILAPEKCQSDKKKIKKNANIETSTVPAWSLDVSLQYVKE